MNFEDAENHLSDMKILESVSGNTFGFAGEIPDANRKYIASISIETPDSHFLIFIINGGLVAEGMSSNAKFRISIGGNEIQLM